MTNLVELCMTGMEKETILENSDRFHLPTASEVCFLRAGDLEEGKLAGNHAILLRLNIDITFLIRNCNAAASASNYSD